MVSIVIPVFDEVEALPALLAELQTTLDALAIEYEILFVDDGSSDGSGEWLDSIAARDLRVRTLHFRRNSGQSAAFAAGFQSARGEYIVTLDADGQNPPQEIPSLLEPLLSGQADLVAGYRIGRQDNGWRRLQSRIANAVRNRLTGETIRDTGCSLKAFRREFVVGIPMYRGMHRFLPTLCRLEGAKRVIEVAVSHRPRTTGSSKYGMWNRALGGFADLLAVRWMQRRWLRYEVRDER